MTKPVVEFSLESREKTIFDKSEEERYIKALVNKSFM